MGHRTGESFEHPDVEKARARRQQPQQAEVWAQPAQS